MKSKRPYNLKVIALADDNYEIGIRGIIGEYLDMESWTRSDTEQDVLNELAKIPAGKKIAVRVQSKGGQVDLGLGIYNALSRRKADITTYNDGYACSAASIIMLAGSRRVCPSSSLTMIHRAQGGVEGTGDDMRTMAEGMDTIDGIMAQTYANVSGKKSKEEFAAMMKATTWMSGEQAVENGLATECQGEAEDDDDMDAPTAKAELAMVARYKNCPENLRSRLSVRAQAAVNPPQPPTNQPTKKDTMNQIIAALVAAGFNIPTGADENAVLPHITALITDRRHLKTQVEAFAGERKNRVTLLVNAAVTDKIIADTRGPGLIALGETNEAEVIAQITELRAAKAAKPNRGAPPAKLVIDANSTAEEITARMEEVQDQIHNPATLPAVRAALVRESLKLRGFDKLKGVHAEEAAAN